MTRVDRGEADGGSGEALCDVSPNGPEPLPGVPGTCLVCGLVLASRRQRFCSPAHRQQGFRLRHAVSSEDLLATLARELRTKKQLTAQTVYECSGCGERLLGSWRCEDCNLMCRKLGLGGEAGDGILLVTELLGLE